MRGVIMETKNGRAVLLTKGGDFVNIEDKGYSVGDKISILNTGRFCAAAASFVIFFIGIGSYFVPSGYVSVDINPSLMMTLNLYNRVIDVQSFNNDARVLLDKTDIKGKGAEESVEILIKTSEEIGYINDNNRDVILEVVPGMIKPNMEKIQHSDIKITNEIADMETLRIAKNIGVSMAKVKALEEYTEKNGGDIRSNAAKFNDKSAKELRVIMQNNSYISDMLQKIPESEIQQNMPEQSPQSQQNDMLSYDISNNQSSADESEKKENISSVNHKSDENIPFHNDGKSQENLHKEKRPPHGDMALADIDMQIGSKPKEDIPPQYNTQTAQREISKSVQEKVSDDSKSIHMEKKLHNDLSDPEYFRPQNEKAKHKEPMKEENKPSDTIHEIPEPKLPENSSDKENTENIKSKEPMKEENRPSDTIHEIPEPKLPENSSDKENTENIKSKEPMKEENKPSDIIHEIPEPKRPENSSDKENTENIRPKEPMKEENKPSDIIHEIPEPKLPENSSDKENTENIKPKEPMKEENKPLDIIHGIPEPKPPENSSDKEDTENIKPKEPLREENKPSDTIHEVSKPKSLEDLSDKVDVKFQGVKEPLREENKPLDIIHETTEPKPPENPSDQRDENSTGKQNPDKVISPDRQPYDGRKNEHDSYKDEHSRQSEPRTQNYGGNNMVNE